MSVAWTILHGGEYKSFASLGLANLTRVLVNQGIDTVRFDAPGTAFDGAALFAYGSTVIIKKGSVQWFYGRCVTLPRQGGPADERITYEVAGPWWYLGKCGYQQSWKIYNTGAEELQDKYKTRIILNQNASGDRITSGVQINDAVDWAIAKGAPITRGTVDPAVNLPFDEQTDIACSEVILKMLRWSPECVTWFDYSTTPYPTFQCRKRTNLGSVSLSVSGSDELEQIAITPRYDLQIPGVVINYEQHHDIDGMTYETVSQDTAGATGAIDTVHFTMELAGARATFLTQKLKTEDWPDPLDDKDWWQDHVPALGALSQDDFEINAATRDGELALDRILTEGTIHEWMQDDDENEIQQEEETVTASINYNVKDGDDIIKQIWLAPFTVRVTATDAETKTYRKLESLEAGEAVPSGVAAALYTSWNELQYDGLVVLVEEDVSGAAFPGRKLNLTGGAAAWSSMNALVQQVTEQVDEGRTSITIGPAKHLGPDDIISLLQASRRRRASWKFIARTTGESADAGAAELSGPAAKNEATNLDGETGMMILTDDGGTHKKIITVDPSDIADTSQEHNVKPREVLIWGTDSACQKRQVMASAAYGTDLASYITVLTALKIDTTNLLIQIKSRTVKVVSYGAESGWTTITGGTGSECNET